MKTTESRLNPYPGLRPFEFHENHLFFGREGQSEKLLKKLRRSRFVAVVGTSGSGKSSLVRAGLFHLLYGGFMAKAGPRWRLAVLRPGTDPIHNLAIALNTPDVFESSQYEQSPDISEVEPGTGVSHAERVAADKQAVTIAAAETILRRSSRGLVDYVKRARMADGENLLVVVDQFEELFRFKENTDREHSSDEAAAFVKLLLESIGEKGVPVYVVLTMRSDFLGDCAQFRDLPEAINESQYLIPRMTRSEQRDAITCPVSVREARMTPRLVQRLLNDVGDNPDQLPILQHALMRTWEFWVTGPRGGGVDIDIEHYEAIGGMEEALSKHADKAYNGLPDERSKEVAKKVFKILTETGRENREVRRPAELHEICDIAGATPNEVTTVIEAFRKPGRSFLVPPAKVELQPDTLVDISHESLIKGWAQLKTWVEEEAQSAQMYRRLAEDALLYKENKVGLWSDPGLTFALKWLDEQQPTPEWAARYHPAFKEALTFLEASREHRDRAAAAEAQRQQDERDREKRLLEFEMTAVEAKRLKAEAEQRRAEAERKLAEDAQLAAQRVATINLKLAEEQKHLAEVEHQRAEEQARAAHDLRIAAKKQSRTLRLLRATVALLILMLLLAVAATGYAFIKRSEADRATVLANEQSQAAIHERQVSDQRKQEADEQRALAQQRSEELAGSLKSEKSAKERAEAEATRANEQAQLAQQAQSAALGAQETAKQEARTAKELAEKEKLAREKDEKNRDAMLLLEMGQLKEAEEKFNKEVLLAYADDSKGLSWVRYNLGALYTKQGNYPRAEGSYTSALGKHIEQPGEETEATLAIHNRLAHLYQEQGKYTEAEDNYKPLFSVRCKSSETGLDLYLCDAPSHDDDARLYLTETRSDLAELFRAHAKDKDTIATQKRVAIEAKLKEQDKPSGAEGQRPDSESAPREAQTTPKKAPLADRLCLEQKGDLKDLCGEYIRLKASRDDDSKVAEKLYLKVLSDLERTQPHSTAAANRYADLARVFEERSGSSAYRAGELNELATMIRGLKIKNPGEFNGLDLGKKEKLAKVYYQAERYDLAQNLYESIRDEKLTAVASKPKELRQFNLELALLYEARKDYKPAKSYYEKARPDSVTDIELNDRGRTYWEEMAGFYCLQKNEQEAEKYHLLNVGAYRNKFVNDSSFENRYKVQIALVRLGFCRERQKEYAKAADALAEALNTIEEGQRGDKDPFLIYPLYYLGEMYQKQGDMARAEQSLTRALTIWRASLKDNPADAVSVSSYGYSLEIKKNSDITIRPTYYIAILGRLASVYVSQGKTKEAEKLYRDADAYLRRMYVHLPSALESMSLGRADSIKRAVYAEEARLLNSYAKLLRQTRPNEADEKEALATKLKKMSKDQFRNEEDSNVEEEDDYSR